MDTRRIEAKHQLQGEVFYGETHIKNNGLATWELVSAETSCGCASVSVEPRVLLPNSSGKVSISVDTTGVRGPRPVTVVTEWQQRNKPKVRVRRDVAVNLNVESLIYTQPSRVDLGRISWDRLLSGISLDMIRGNSVLPWNNISIESAAFDVNVTKQEKNSFRATAFPKAKEPIYGYLSEEFLICAKMDGTPVGRPIRVPIKAWIYPGVMVSPSTIFVNTVSVGEVTNGVIFLNSAGEDFHVISVSASEPECLEFDPVVKNGKATELRFKMTGIKPGQHSGIATVTMRLGAETRKFNLPYMILVKGGAALSSESANLKRLSVDK